MSTGLLAPSGSGESRRAVVLLDGDHHPPVLRRALAEMKAAGTEPLTALVLGGGEKLVAPGVPPDLSIPARWPAHAEHELFMVVQELRPDVVVDLSGEPVIDPYRRLRLAAVALARGVAYEAPGVRYTPPEFPSLTTRSTVAVIGTGKRAGKTAMAGALVRHAQLRGRRPVLVAMGRGGPPDPTVVPAGDRLDTDRLLEIVADGGHAASDFYEDAITTGAATVGCSRVGDGPGGEVACSTLGLGVARAEELPGDLTVLEGSGAALPPCAADVTALIVPATMNPDELMAALPLRFILADLVLITFVSATTADRVSALDATIRELLARLPRRSRAGHVEVEVIATDFHPHPLGDVAGRRVLFTTTAPEAVAREQIRQLEQLWDANVVACSPHLADRPALLDDLRHAPDHDVVLTELKAAAVDVVVRAARDSGTEVVFCDHRPVRVRGYLRKRSEEPFDAVLDGLVALADRRHANR